MMLENESTPIMEKITCQKNLSPCQRRRLNRLKEIFRKEGRIPLETSLQEMRYLLRLEAVRKRYRRNRWATIPNQRDWKEATKSVDPHSDCTIEEILAQLARQSEKQSGGSEK